LIRGPSAGQNASNKRLSKQLQVGERALFIGAHEPTITGNIRRHHSRKPSLHAPVISMWFKPMMERDRPPTRCNLGINFHIVKFGLNYKFGGPIVAKY
jgi:hypothetical protein